jgi:ribonuclease HII
MPVLFCYVKHFVSPGMSLPPMARNSASYHAIPTFDEETRLWAAGFGRIAGLDEAGRGALAGPVVAGAVIAPVASSLTGIWAKVRDSKLLRPATRETLALSIEREALAWGVGIVEAAVID